MTYAHIGNIIPIHETIEVNYETPAPALPEVFASTRYAVGSVTVYDYPVLPELSASAHITTLEAIA